MRFTAFAAVLAVLVSAVYSEKIKGMAFSTGHDLNGYRQPYADQSLQQLKAAGANYVHISAYAKMDNLKAMYARRETDDYSIRYIIRKAKSKGLKVFFKPVIEVENNIWRGFINGTPEWFNQVYIPFISQMARIAQQEGVNLFAVGSELRNTESKTEQWYKVIAQVRRLFKGKITYVGNHDSYQTVKFFQRVDLIAISGYYSFLPGTYGYSPNLAKTVQLWQQKAQEVENWRKRTGLTNKKVIIAEFGAPSKGKGVVYRVPWDWLVKAPLNYWEQVKMYEGFFRAFLPKAWCDGVLLWNWELEPDAGKYGDSRVGYTPQNKPALAVMKRFFYRNYN